MTTSVDEMAAQLWVIGQRGIMIGKHRAAFDVQPASVQDHWRKVATVALNHAEQAVGLLRIAEQRLQYADTFIATNRGGNGLRNPARTDTLRIIREFLK